MTVLSSLSSASQLFEVRGPLLKCTKFHGRLCPCNSRTRLCRLIKYVMARSCQLRCCKRIHILSVTWTVNVWKMPLSHRRKQQRQRSAGWRSSNDFFAVVWIGGLRGISPAAFREPAAQNWQSLLLIIFDDLSRVIRQRAKLLLMKKIYALLINRKRNRV